jgi:hypothetical protein
MFSGIKMICYWIRFLPPKAPDKFSEILFIYIKEMSKKKNKTIFHNILVLTFSLLLQIFRYNVYSFDFLIYIYSAEIS